MFLCLCSLTNRLPLYLVFLLISLLFLVVNLVCALLVRMSSAEAHTIVLVRVTINDTLFVLCAISLALCLYKIAKMSLANIYLESKVRHPASESQTGPPLCDCADVLNALASDSHWHQKVSCTRV